MNTTVKNATILVVEDESLCGLWIQELLEKAGYLVPEVLSSADEVLDAVQRRKPDLVVMDINLKSYIDGIDAASRLRMVSDASIIYVTAYPEKCVEHRARKTRAAAYLQKPLDESILLEAIERALEERASSAQAENRALPRLLSEDQCRAAIRDGDFGPDVIRASPRVAVILTQTWCPQWTRMKSWVDTLSAEEGRAVFYVEYDRETFFEEFMAFKEEKLGNREIPYVRYYHDGVLCHESNFIDQAGFISLL